jgi:hypothetical protein
MIRLHQAGGKRLPASRALVTSAVFAVVLIMLSAALVLHVEKDRNLDQFAKGDRLARERLNAALLQARTAPGLAALVREAGTRMDVTGTPYQRELLVDVNPVDVSSITVTVNVYPSAAARLPFISISAIARP